MPLIINGQEIDEDIIEQEFANIKSNFESMSQYHICCERDEEFRGYAKRNIITRVLLTQEAQRSIDPVSDEQVDAEVEKLMQQHGGQDQFYATFNIGPEQEHLVRRDVDLNIRVQQLLDSVIGDEIEPSAQELRAFYEKHIDRFMKPEKVRVSHLVKNPKHVEDREAAYELLRKVRRQALDGADFVKLAREHTDAGHEWEDEAAPATDKERRDGIDLGFFGRGEMMEEFERMAFSMKVGEISPVFITMFGMHLFKVTDRMEATPKPFDEVRDEVKQQLLNERREAKVQAYVKQLEAGAQIEDTDETDNGDGESS